LGGFDSLPDDQLPLFSVKDTPRAKTIIDIARILQKATIYGSKAIIELKITRTTIQKINIAEPIPIKSFFTFTFPPLSPISFSLFDG